MGKISPLAARLKLSRSQKLNIVYAIFILLYTIYIAGWYRNKHKGDSIWYYLKFELISSYTYFILQRLFRRSGDWYLVLIFPLVVSAGSVIIVFLLLWIIRWGGGDLLDNDAADMIAAALVSLAGSFYLLRFLGKPRK